MAQAFDRALETLSPAQRWRVWMGRIEAAVFSSATPLSTQELGRLVGEGVSVDLVIADIQAELTERPYALVPVAGGWMMRTRAQFAQAIRAVADVGAQVLDLSEFEMTVLAAIAYHQPLTRAGLKEIFGKDISRDLVGRLGAQGLITTGPRSPRAGAPYTYVTTPEFLTAFDLGTLRDLPDMDLLDETGLPQR